MELILAVNSLYYIGLDNGLPWRSSEDLKHFKKLTMGKKLLVGRTTYEHMPKLPGRELIVVGTGYNTLEEGLEQNPDYVIGGAKLVESVLDKIEFAHISHIHDETIGDVKLPEKLIDLVVSGQIPHRTYQFKAN